jgi:hypothetical protein
MINACVMGISLWRNPWGNLNLSWAKFKSDARAIKVIKVNLVKRLLEKLAL